MIHLRTKITLSAGKADTRHLHLTVCSLAELFREACWVSSDVSERVRESFRGCWITPVVQMSIGRNGIFKGTLFAQYTSALATAVSEKHAWMFWDVSDGIFPGGVAARKKGTGHSQNTNRLFGGGVENSFLDALVHLCWMLLGRRLLDR